MDGRLLSTVQMPPDLFASIAIDGAKNALYSQLKFSRFPDGRKPEYGREEEGFGAVIEKDAAVCASRLLVVAESGAD